MRRLKKDESFSLSLSSSNSSILYQKIKKDEMQNEIRNIAVVPCKFYSISFASHRSVSVGWKTLNAEASKRLRIQWDAFLLKLDSAA